MFTTEELNRLRQWFEDIEDVHPSYIERRDRDLYVRIKAALPNQSHERSAGHGVH